MDQSCGRGKFLAQNSFQSLEERVVRVGLVLWRKALVSIGVVATWEGATLGQLMPSTPLEQVTMLEPL
jgi:hypothetical protein